MKGRLLFMNKKQKWIAGIGAFCGILYFLHRETLYFFNRTPQPVEDFICGLLLGVTAALLLISLLPESPLKRLRAWKRHGK